MATSGKSSGGLIVPTRSGSHGSKERIVFVPSGKDVLSEILSICEKGYGIRVAYAHGLISACTLKQPGCDGATVVAPYTGMFRIDSCKGVFLPPSLDWMKTNGLQVSLCHKTSKSGRKIQGVVSDRLIVADGRQVRVIMYVFKVDGEILKTRLEQLGEDGALDEIVRFSQPNRISVPLIPRKPVPDPKIAIAKARKRPLKPIPESKVRTAKARKKPLEPVPESEIQIAKARKKEADSRCAELNVKLASVKI